MDDRDFDRRSANRVVHYKKIDSICQKTGIVSRGIELSSIVELQNLDKIGKNNLSEVDPSVWLKREEELRGQYKLKEALDLINLVLKVKPKLKEAYYYKYQILLFGNLRGEISDNEVIECMYAVLNNSQKEFYILDRDSKDMDYEIYVNLGDRLSNISDYENAIKAFNNAISLFPDYISAWDLKADCLSKQGKHDAAIYYYDKAINILKIKVVDNTGYRSRLADDLIHKGICLKRLKRYDSAIDLYKEALEINPNQDRAWEYIGLALVEQGKNEEANLCYKKEIANSKWAYKAWNNLARNLNEMRENEEALNAANEGLIIKPDYDLLIYTKVEILTNSKRYDEALVVLDEYLKLKPEDAGALNWMGVVLSWLEKHDEAIIYYEKAHKEKKDYYLPLVNKARSLLKLIKYEEALDSLMIAKSINPNISETWEVLGDVLSKMGRTTEANEALKMAKFISSDKVPTGNPNIATTWFDKGNALYDLKLYDEAIAAFDRAIAIDPNDPMTWNNKGGALYVLKRYDEAIKHYKHALDIDPNHEVALDNLGLTLYALKRYDEALVFHNSALAIDPNFAAAWSHKGDTLNALNRHDEADEAFKRAKSINPN